MLLSIEKRDGRVVPYDISKIEKAIKLAMEAAGRGDSVSCLALADDVEMRLVDRYTGSIPGIEAIQDIVEEVLMDHGFPRVAKLYHDYRVERTREREKRTSLMRRMNELDQEAAAASDIKRDNANIDGDTPMGTMLKFGSESAKDYYEKYILTRPQSEAHEQGDIHIHDFDFYTLTTTCCQIDIRKLFEGGFSTGHGHLREPNSIHSYAALACIAIQSNQNDQHGGQSIPFFDFGLAPGVSKTYRKLYVSNYIKALRLLAPEFDLEDDEIKAVFADIEGKHGLFPQLRQDPEYAKRETEAFLDAGAKPDLIEKVRSFVVKTAEIETDREVKQAMEALVHNLNTMHSRAGAQTPFSSINYGTDTSPEGRLVSKNVMLATEEGLGNGETPIFPIHVFKVKEGVNFNEGEPNYDLFKLACRVSAKRLYPNFSFIDAPYNIKFYEEGRPETEVAYMGCRTRVIANVYDPDNQIVVGRGNLSFTSINLPRIAIKSSGSIEWFFEELERKMKMVTDQLYDRYTIQSKKKVRNFPFLMGQGIWLDSDKLGINDEVGEVLKHGTLSMGFIGLAEALVALIGSHHGETKEAENLGLEIVGFMRGYLDRLSEEKQMNFTLLSTPAEGLAGRFVRLDKKKYGEVKGVTDRDYYTNGFHIPVYHSMSAFEKIRVEAPYHALANAGHITFVELDGDPVRNLDAFEHVIRAMKEAGVGYGSINHPVDRDPVCGYSGVIDDICPGCGRTEDEGDYGFERIRRITGYLVGTLDRFNDAKRAEEKDRVKHGLS
ncbi:MAG: anaerobic ribonucleoside triphosphate reductase [Clostridiales bacterium]|nr:anaerobic ribonucleoside triphosphate reductase [Clostridiales bacterium]